MRPRVMLGSWWRSGDAGSLFGLRLPRRSEHSAVGLGSRCAEVVAAREVLVGVLVGVSCRQSPCSVCMLGRRDCWRCDPLGFVELQAEHFR